jgi:DNA-binding transcriptional ArsR family regulator
MLTASPTDALAALADPTRRGIFEQLARGGEQNVATLTAKAGVSQPMVSRHLAVLSRAGLAQSRPAGRQTFYSARAAGLRPVIGWIAHYRAFWTERVGRLEQLLETMEP